MFESLRQKVLGYFLEIRYSIEMDPQHISSCFDQSLIIIQRLRTDQCAKGQAFGGNVKILLRLSSDDEEQCVLRSAFVELTG